MKNLALRLHKHKINIMAAFGLYFKLLDDYTFNLENLGEVKITQEDCFNLINAYMAIISSNMENKTEILKLLFSQKDNDIIDLGFIKFINIYQGLKLNLDGFIEVFFGSEYPFDDIWGGSEKIVIDIGVNLGDSSLFFAKKGYKVIGFEPLKEVYEIAIKNIDINNLNDRIILINKGVSSKKGFIDLYFDGIKSSLEATTKSYSKSSTKEKVEVVTIDDIIEKFSLKNPFLLKIDCEGCESEIILNSNLSMFQEIIFEYHTHLNGVKHGQLTDKLEKEGFSILYHKVHVKNNLGIIHMRNINLQ